MYGSDVKTKDTNKYSSASKNAKRHFEDDQPCILSFMGVMITKCVLNL